jgi:tetratricopeptide (TPR) repeat protein
MKTKINNIIWFKLIAIVIPFVFLFLAEVALQVFHIGQDLSLFIEHPENSDYLILNPNISRRYFVKDENSTRGCLEPFKKKKEPGTIRIFVQGSSTAYGFPYENNGSFPRMLQYQFNQNFPNRNIEIINLSITAVNSYTLVDFVDKIIKQQPDAILIYAGHNEFYGALGVGSSGNLGSNPMIVRFGIQFRKLRLGQLFFRLMLRITKPASSDLSETLMKRMAEDQSIKKGSVLYKKGIKQFNQNISKLLGKYQKNNVPVFVGTLFSNLKDQAPFISDSDTKENAEYFFTRAKESEKKHDFAQALQFYTQAKDEDLLRFRAPEAINENIKALAKEFGAILVPVEEDFKSNSLHGIVGNELVLEHLHPNLKGYYLLSTSFYRSLIKHLKFSTDQKVGLPLSFEEIPLTEMDSLFGEYTNLILRSQWPFNEPMPDIDLTGESMPEVLAGGLAVKQINWDESMHKLQKYYLDQKEYKDVFKVSESLALAYPMNLDYQIQAGQFATNVGEYKKALVYYNKAFKRNPNLKILAQCVKAGVSAKAFDRLLSILDSKTVQQLDNPLVAQMKSDIVELQKAEGIQKLRSDNISVLQILTKLYYDFGVYHFAKEYAEKLAQLEPGNSLAIEILKRTNK